MRVLRLTGIDNRVFTQDWSCGYAAPAARPYCVHIETDTDWKRAVSVLSGISETPMVMLSNLRVSLTLISVILGIALIALLS
jgi:hypothetical protein